MHRGDLRSTEVELFRRCRSLGDLSAEMPASNRPSERSAAAVFSRRADFLKNRRRVRCPGAGPGARRRRHPARRWIGPCRSARRQRGSGSSRSAGSQAASLPGRAKRVIFLFMNGGPSHVDTFDPKPALERYAGQDPPAAVATGRRKRGKIMPSPFPARPHGQSGI